MVGREFSRQMKLRDYDDADEIYNMYIPIYNSTTTTKQKTHNCNVTNFSALFSELEIVQL